MSRIYFKTTYLLLAVFLITACKTYYPVSQQQALIKVNNSVKEDASVKTYYKPFKDSLDKIMKVPLAVLAEDLTKKQPESTLGNLMADMLKVKTEEYYGQKIDIAVLNYGGIRVPSLTKGTLMIEHAYLLMPFDNYLTVQILSGQQLNDFCDSIAMKNGWPVSGISFQIKDGKAINILVNKEPIDLSKKYHLATNDYLSNGGDGMAMLKNIPQIQTGKLFRDAIIEYWKAETKSGKKISATLENRISYAE